MKFSTRVIIMIGLVLLAFAGLSWITYEVMIEKEDEVDQAIINMLPTYTTPGMTSFMKVMTFLGSREFLIAGYLVIIAWYLFHRKRKKTAFNTALIGTIGMLLVSVLKYIFKRPRPLDPLLEKLPNYSFPSGHTTSGFIFYGLLMYLVWRNKQLANPAKYALMGFFFLISLFIGISRIYLRMHYPSDVAAGFCLGFIWLAISLFTLHRLEKKSVTFNS